MNNPATAARVNAWNNAVPEGSDVLVVKDDGQIAVSRTKGPAWLLGGHTAVVGVQGIGGGYSLERVIPVVEDPRARGLRP